MPCFRPFRVFCALNTHNHPRHEDEEKQRLGLVISPLDSQLTASVRSFFVLAATKAPLAILFQASSPSRSQSALIYFQSADLALHACMLIVSRYQPSPLLFLSPLHLERTPYPHPMGKEGESGVFLLLLPPPRSFNIAYPSPSFLHTHHPRSFLAATRGQRFLFRIADALEPVCVVVEQSNR